MMSEFNSILSSFSAYSSPSNNVDTSSSTTPNESDFIYEIVGKYNELNTAYNHLQYQFNNSMIQQQRVIDDQIKRLQLLETQYCSLQNNLDNMKKLWLSDSSWINTTTNCIWNPQEIQLNQKNNSEDVLQLKTYVVDLHEQLNNLQARFNSMYQQSMIQEQKLMKFVNLSQSMYTSINAGKSASPVALSQTTQTPIAKSSSVDIDISDCVDSKDNVLTPQQTKHVDLMFVVMFHSGCALPSGVYCETQVLKHDVFDLFQDQTVDYTMKVEAVESLHSIIIYLQGRTCFFINEDVSVFSQRYQSLIAQAFNRYPDECSIEDIFTGYKTSSTAAHYEFIHSSSSSVSLNTTVLPADNLCLKNNGLFHRTVSLFPNTNLPIFNAVDKKLFSTYERKNNAYYEFFKGLLINLFACISKLINIRSFATALNQAYNPLQTTSSLSFVPVTSERALTFIINGFIDMTSNSNVIHLLLASKFIHKCLYVVLNKYSLASSLTIFNDSLSSNLPSKVPMMYRNFNFRKNAPEFIPTSSELTMNFKTNQ